MRVMVFGGRHWAARAKSVQQSVDEASMLRRALVAIHNETPITCLVHGGATGADSCGAAWAEAFGIPTERHRAQWQKHGPSAGPIRNQAMVASGIDIAVACPGGRGTADMQRRCDAAGIRVVHVGGEVRHGKPQAQTTA